MKILLFILSFGFHSSFVLSQTGEIRGIVKILPDNDPGIGCSVWLDNGTIGTITDSIGSFSLSKVPSGRYVLHSQSTGTCEVCLPDVIVTNDTLVEIDIQLQSCCLLGGELFCPKCLKSDQIVPIVYGKPTPKTIKRAGRNEVHLGGCMISECNANFFCNRDNTEIKF